MKGTSLERIKMPPPDVFYREYMCKLRPVVITDFFEGERVREINSKAKALDAWGRVPIPVDEEYDNAITIAQVRAQLRDRQSSRDESANHDNEASRQVDVPTMSIAEYYDFVERNAEINKARVVVLPMFMSPAALKEWYRIPEVCRSMSDESPEFHHCFFIGKKGSFSPIHFDKDGLHGFFYQLFGKKRFIVFPHSASHKLAPFTRYSIWCLQHFSKADREDFLKFTGGKEAILDAGDCIYFPAFCWHYVDYLEDCWTIHLRGRRTKHVTALINAFFPDIYMQGIGHKLAGPGAVDGKYAAILGEIEKASAEQYADGREKVRRMRELARAIYARLYPDSPRDPYMADIEEFFPPPLPEFLDADNPRRPKYK